LAQPAEAQQPAEWLAREFWIMGTSLTVRLSGHRAEAATEDAFEAVSGVGLLLDTWSGESELVRLNRGPVGSPCRLSPALDSLLAQVFVLADSTHRAYDPTVGALDDAWDLRGAGRIPDSASLQDALAATGSRALIYAAGTMTRHHPAAWLDPDGFGKGAALRAAAARLTRHGVDHALLSFGGQVLAVGTWEVPVADPRNRARPAATLRINNASAATSAQSERGIEVAGRWYGHVLDPRSGRPVTPWGSVTVVHDDPLFADVLSTALFVMGPRQGLQWAEDHGVAALFLMDTAAGLVIRISTHLDRMGGVITGD
jgi:thiamine biosynthesis lipoprotein